MTDKPIVLKGLERIERYLSEAETSLDIARDYMQEFLDDIKINDEVSLANKFYKKSARWNNNANWRNVWFIWISFKT